MKLIPLTKGLFAQVDEADFDLLSRVKWYADTSNAKPRARNRAVGFMHTFLLPGLGQIDHVDGDPLNNQRENLRPASDSQNQHNKGKQRNNTSGYKGVWRDRKSGMWRAQIAAFGKSVGLGSYTTPERAHEAYCFAATKMHGEFARVC